MSNPICIDCGLCCDGSLHGSVKVKQTKNKGNQYKNSKIKLTHTITQTFSQPCAEYCEGSGCQIYSDRPNTCQNYSCKVLTRVKNNKISTQKARGLIKSAKSCCIILNEHFDKVVCFAEPLNLVGKFLLLYGKNISSLSARKKFIKDNKKIYRAYFAFDYLLDEFIRKKAKYPAEKIQGKTGK